jgi:DNA ligase-1
MSEKFQPMLAKPIERAHARFPMYASPKLDGIRCIIKDGVALSRSLKPIKNKYVQSVLGRVEFNGLDGELIVGPLNAPNAMQATTSGVMSVDGTPDFTFVVFDCWSYDAGYAHRYDMLNTMTDEQKNAAHIKVLMQHSVHNWESMEAKHAEFTNAGFEGTIVRSPVAPYKFGRSTAREGYLLKFVDWEYDEAIVVGFEERMSNQNELGTDERGYAHRTSHKAGQVATGMLGAFIVRSEKWPDQTFNVSAGSVTLVELAEFWHDRLMYEGKIVRFKHKPHGQKDVPRHPLFAGFRDEDDMS